MILSSFGGGGAIVVPLTTKLKENKFTLKVNESSFVNLTQIRFVDSKRLKRKLFEIDGLLLRNIKNRVFKILKSY